MAEPEWKRRFFLVPKEILDESTNEFVLNGGKAFISSAGMSDIYLVMARTGGTGRRGELLDSTQGRPGLSFGADEKKWMESPTNTQVIFEDCRIPASNLLGEEEQIHMAEWP